MDGLSIISENKDDNISRFWKFIDISTESLSSGQQILLSYGDFPHERLEVKGEGADQLLSSVSVEENIIKQYQHKITRSNPLKLVVTGLAVLAIVVYAYVAHISPFIGEQAVKILPKSVEAKAGEMMYKNMSYLFEVDEDKSALLLEFYESCGFESEYDIRFDYANNDMVNAFAVPGGQIVVFEGLIKETKNWDELAALMGHELAHVNERHSFKQLARSITGYLILSVLTGDVAGASSIILENASQINNMANSREHEKEADVKGLEYLRESQIRPEAMVDLFKRIAGDSDSSQVIKLDDKRMEYLSTHPLTTNRITYLKELINDDSYSYEPKEVARAKEIWEELKENVGEGSEMEIIETVNEVIKEKLGIEMSDTIEVAKNDVTEEIQDTLH